MSENMKKHKTSVGGQALIEGIMMRGPKGMALSVRVPSGEIETEYKDVNRLKDKHKIFGAPFLRGIVSFIESLILGYQCLMESAEKSGMGDEEEENLSKFDKWINDKFGDKIMDIISVLATIVGIAFAVVIFLWLPTFLFNSINKYLAGGTISYYRGLIEGLMRFTIFIVYLYSVSKMKDIHRVFQYHGAEHKTIFCYEHGEELTVENVRKQRRFHPRCGTSFILVIFIISILISSTVSIAFPILTKYQAVWILTKILILPIVTAIGYELLMLCARHDNILTKIATAPGLWLQRITTKEPPDDVIEVGIESLKAVITENPEDDEIK